MNVIDDAIPHFPELKGTVRTKNELKHQLNEIKQFNNYFKALREQELEE